MERIFSIESRERIPDEIVWFKISGSRFQFLESVPSKTLRAEVAPELSGELVKGKIVALEVKVTGVLLAYKYNRTPIINPAARIINLNFFKRLKISLVRSAVVTRINIISCYCKYFINK